jgi:hypothetical protein
VPPEPLRRLAEIRHFNLFITTTIDPLLEEALNEVRFGGMRETKWVDYRHNKGEDRSNDLDAEKDELTTTVFYLMGKASSIPGYVLTDEDLLELVCNIQLEARRPKNLFHELEENDLLVLGQNFPDWLARIFLRTVKQRRLSFGRDRWEIVADKHTPRDSDLLYFLGHYSRSTRVYPHGGAVDFVEELCRRWHARNPDSLFNSAEPQIPPPAEMPPAAIFLSYSSEDATAVKKLKAGLDAAGLVAWYDKEQLKGSESFEMKIRRYIRECSCFVPLLSKNTESRLAGFFRREWHWAVEREAELSRPFIFPIVVDDTIPSALKHLDSRNRFAELQMVQLVGGTATPDFVEQLRRVSQQNPGAERDILR